MRRITYYMKSSSVGFAYVPPSSKNSAVMISICNKVGDKFTPDNTKYFALNELDTYKLWEQIVVGFGDNERFKLVHQSNNEVKTLNIGPGQTKGTYGIAISSSGKNYVTFIDDSQLGLLGRWLGIALNKMLEDEPIQTRTVGQRLEGKEESEEIDSAST